MKPKTPLEIFQEQVNNDPRVPAEFKTGFNQGVTLSIHPDPEGQEIQDAYCALSDLMHNSRIDADHKAVIADLIEYLKPL